MSSVATRHWPAPMRRQLSASALQGRAATTGAERLSTPQYARAPPGCASYYAAPTSFWQPDYAYRPVSDKVGAVARNFTASPHIGSAAASLRSSPASCAFPKWLYRTSAIFLGLRRRLLTLSSKSCSRQSPDICVRKDVRSLESRRTPVYSRLGSLQVLQWQRTNRNTKEYYCCR